MNQNLLFLQIETFYIQLQAGCYDHPHNLARALEALANQAWDEVDDIYSLPTPYSPLPTPYSPLPTPYDSPQH